MNDRVQKLFQQACWDQQMEQDIEDVVNVKLFAELLIKDCIQYLTEEAERLYALRNEDADLCAEKCYDNIEGIKERYGVTNV